MAQITSVTSESLQAQIRQLLPSQQGFGEDLQATNVITPIIDLTAAAQGTTTPESLQQALAFGSQTTFRANNSTVAVANSPGFYRVTGTVNGLANSSGGASAEFQMTDGLSTKSVWAIVYPALTARYAQFLNVDLIFFLATSVTLNAVTTSADINLQGSVRQVADVNGNLVNPIGYTPQ